MWNDASERIEDIHAMMVSGHRSVRLDWHTFVLWGVAAALLIFGVEYLFPRDQFPVTWQRVLVTHTFITGVLILVGVWDYRLTLRARAEQDESLSFVQRQVLKVWWLMVALVVLISAGMNLFGGGYLFYPLMTALIGIALYVQGLFSLPMVAWAGLTLVVIALGSLALHLPFALMKWLTISVFGLGMPLLALLLNWKPGIRTSRRRLAAITVWLLSITTPVSVLAYLQRNPESPTSRMMSLAQFLQSSETRGDSAIVRLPAGTIVPIDIHIVSEVLNDVHGTLPMVLSQPLEIGVRNGKPDGWFRVDAGKWKERGYGYGIQDVKITPSMTPDQGPRVALQLRLATDQ